MRISTKTLPLARIQSDGSPGTIAPTLIDHIESTPVDLLAYLRSEQGFKKYLDSDKGDSWKGFSGNDSSYHILSRGYSTSALVSLKSAQASLAAQFTRDKIALSPIGSAFSIGRVELGHPIAAFRRPKTRLAPRRIEFTTRLASKVEAKEISLTMARIVNALWAYHLSGGAVSLRVNYLCSYDRLGKPASGAKGCMISLDIPVLDLSQVATFCSAQFARGIRLDLVDYLQKYSGAKPGLMNPSALTLWGDSRDGELLAKLGIKV